MWVELSLGPKMGGRKIKAPLTPDASKLTKSDEDTRKDEHCRRPPSPSLKGLSAIGKLADHPPLTNHALGAAGGSRRFATFSAGDFRKTAVQAFPRAASYQPGENQQTKRDAHCHVRA